jgi:hypothetical protein
VIMPVPTEKRSEGAGGQERSRTCLVALANCEPGSNVGGDIDVKLADKLYIVARHDLNALSASRPNAPQRTDHLLVRAVRALRPLEAGGDVGRANVDLRTVVDHERVVPTTLVLREDL